MVTENEVRQRKLTAAEQRRLDAFDAVCAELAAQGYRRVDLLIGLVKANVYVLLMSIPVLVLGILAYFAVNDSVPFGSSGLELFGVVVAYLVGIVVHEFIHGFTWSRFTAHGMKDVEFGFIKTTLTPYCTCAQPLSKNSYVIGALMPGIVLGVIPVVIAIFAGWPALFWFGLLMALSAGGDLLIVLKVLRYKTSAADVLFYDHPTLAGCVAFER